MNKQQGQTLIETVVAIFILVMGIVAAVGLAIFAQSSSSNISKQIIATGLAREGIEAVKNMRDTNWLDDETIDTNCYNFASSTANNANCYTTWLTQQKYPASIVESINGQDINPNVTNPSNYVLGYGPNVNNYWILYRYPTIPVCILAGFPRYGLDFFDDPELDPGGNDFGIGFYRPSCNVHGTSDFYRKIILQTVNTGPYNTTAGRRLVVTSQVWWTDKKCPRATDWNTASLSCRVEMTTYLTNWKTY